MNYKTKPWDITERCIKDLSNKELKAECEKIIRFKLGSGNTLYKDVLDYIIKGEYYIRSRCSIVSMLEIKNRGGEVEESELLNRLVVFRMTPFGVDGLFKLEEALRR